MNGIKKSTVGILGTVTFSCLAMYIVEVYIMPSYWVKSAVAFVLFAAIPFAYSVFDKNINLTDCLKFKSAKQLLLSILFGAAVYIFIILAFLIFKEFIDLKSISQILETNVSVTKSNFIYVALYISFVNSFLEEFFFRGFAFLTLKKSAPRVFAYTASASLFSLYHIAILANWFTPALFALVLFGLFLSGLIFNYINEKSGNIYNSWLVHMFANFSINTIGLYMFSII